ncbi:DEAD/DEAH box helicase family protein [Gammaproteobacteria bacterium]|nr:DEAD/DEAH box helicase family protein [Gammaproteobacteria bacterium]
MNEADTRAELIDPQLKAAGWVTGGDVLVQREYNINAGEIKAGGIRAGQLKADYVLSYKNRKLAIVEAKSDELEVGEGVAQAKIYAQKLNLRFTFAANGNEIYQIDMEGSEGDVQSFPSPEELWKKTFGVSNQWQDNFDAVAFEDQNGAKQPRYYQELAVNKAMEAIAAGKDRILLNLATGTGKTFISFQIAWKLFKSRWNMQKDGKRQPRILFLADRNILANQAFLDFGAFGDDAITRINPGEIRRRGEVPTNASIFFTIFQTFMSGPEGEPYFGEYEPDFFDFIIIDECHRGGANNEGNWRGILDYFNSAVHLGLTATPKRKDNVDTYEYFGEPVYTYSLKEGIQDGFLTPFKVKRIQTTLDEYVYTDDDEVLDGEPESGKLYTEGDFNRKIVIKEREQKRVQEMLKAMNPSEKTIVFCANQAHAALVRELINQESENTAVDYCVRVTANDGAIGETYLKQFQDNEKSIPTILTTSQKLSTGVDARNVRNIVLMRPVNNMIEFKQIIGRGTRIYEGKHYFTVIDFVNAYHMFNDPEWDGSPMEPSGGEGPGEGGEGGDGGDVDGGDSIRPKKIKIKLSDGKVREIQAMTSTMFYLDGKPVSAEEFIKKLFDTLKLPEILGSEDDLRELWSNPITRSELISKLEKHGCSKDDLNKLRELIDAEDSDLFDVLQYIAYSNPAITRKERVDLAEDNIYQFINKDQVDFIRFVLNNYIQEGIDELDIANLSTIINAKYGSINEAQKELGSSNEIKEAFTDFQKYLYQKSS